MTIYERELTIPIPSQSAGLIQYLRHAVEAEMEPGEAPIRFVITRDDGDRYFCEVGVLRTPESSTRRRIDNIFRFERRPVEHTETFNAILLVPTGIGAELGGHDGDAGSLAQLIGSACDTLVLHPNVVNASDINEMPANALYVEGSVISRLLMGTIGLQPVRANRVLTLVDKHQIEHYISSTINSVSAARATYGLKCPAVVTVDPPIRMENEFTSSGRASGRIEGLEELCSAIEPYHGRFDALAISSIIYVPYSYHLDYYQQEGKMVNPWGGVEALLTHTLSLLYNLPSAHAPMLESHEIEALDPGVVDPRMAAEAVSLTYMQSVLKGLKRSPRIMPDPDMRIASEAITAADISCLIIPDGCVGLPTLAALEQGIPTIAVIENKNLMQNRLQDLPWAEEQLIIVQNYWEAIGVMQALKIGITPESVRRPLSWTTVAHHEAVHTRAGGQEAEVHSE